MIHPVLWSHHSEVGEKVLFAVPQIRIRRAAPELSNVRRAPNHKDVGWTLAVRDQQRPSRTNRWWR